MNITNNNDYKNQKIKNFIPLLVKGLYKKYSENKHFSIENLNFEIKPGEFYGFNGANGARKTTTIKSIIGAYFKIKDEIKIFGEKQTEKNKQV